MSQRVFSVRTEPHEAVIGDVTLLFVAETTGAEFATAYESLRAAQQKVKAAGGNKASGTKHAKEDQVDAAVLIELSEAMRTFVGSFLTPESVDAFASLRLPDRVLVELLEWTSELYGSGSGNLAAAGGTSSG